MTSTSAFLGIDIVDPAVDASLAAILAEVEAELHATVHSADPLVAEASLHLMEAGGKRFRPMLVALAAQFGLQGSRADAGSGAGRTAGGVAGSAGTAEGGEMARVTGGDGVGGAHGARTVAAADRAAEADPEDVPLEVVKAAVVVELTHLATLYHDDVMDEALVRRGAPSANARWSNSLAILVGDYLFSRAASVAAELGPEAVRIQAATFARLVHGQIAETVGVRDGEDPVAHYLHVLAEKTGSLIATSARFGAMFGGATPTATAAIAEYGEAIGIAFQLSDDLLDIASESAQSGKTPGTDLREGVPTLPVLYALAGDDGDTESIRLRQILSRGAVTDDAEHAEALSLLRQSAAMKLARETVRTYAERARTYLGPLPTGPARQALEAVCDLIADRTA